MFATVVVLIPLMNGVYSSTHDRVCDNESHIKLSVIKGLQDNHRVKINRVHEIEKQLEEAEKEADKAKLKVTQVQALVNKTINDADKMAEKIENMTTPELMELEEQQICSEDAFVTDCCQVMYSEYHTSQYFHAKHKSKHIFYKHTKYIVFIHRDTNCNMYIIYMHHQLFAD